MRRLKIAETITKKIEFRFSFKAGDGTERVIMQVPYVDKRRNEVDLRGVLNSNFINRKIEKAVNIILGKYKDMPNSSYQQSYFVTITNPYIYNKRELWVGFPLRWQSVEGDIQVQKYTKLNFGKLVNIIVRTDRKVVPSSRHNDLPIKVAQPQVIIEV